MTAMTCFSSGLEHPSSFEHTLSSFKEFEARLRASSPTSVSSCAPKLPSRRAGRNQPKGRRASIIEPSLWLNLRPVAKPTRRQIRRVQGFAFFFFALLCASSAPLARHRGRSSTSGQPTTESVSADQPPLLHPRRVRQAKQQTRRLISLVCSPSSLCSRTSDCFPDPRAVKPLTLICLFSHRRTRTSFLC